MPLLPRSLEEHASFVRALAQSLVRDPHGADDIVQDTWVAALRAEGSVGEPRAWLARVVSRLAMRSRRSAARRSSREAAVARPETDACSPDTVAAQRELLHRLTNAVLALDEPYQTTVLQRFYEGRSAREIATRTGEPLTTVRRRIQVALERLRARLDREWEGDRDAWCRGLAPFLGVGKLASIELGKGVGVGWRGWIMGTTAKMTIGLAAAGLAALLLWWGGGALESHDLASSERTAPLVEEPAVRATSAPSREENRSPLVVDAAAPSLLPPARPAFPPQPSSTVGTLELRVRWADGTPAPDVAAHVMPWGANDSFLMAREVRTDPNGLCSVDQLAPGSVVVYLDRGSVGDTEIQAGRTSVLELELEEGFTVHGRVLDPEAHPVPGASVLLSDYGNTGNGRLVATSDAEGRFEIRALEDGHSLSARAPGHGPSAQVHLAAARGAVLEMDLNLRGPGGALHGIVLDPEGFPLAGARVRLVSPSAGGGLEEVDGRWFDPRSLPVELRTDEMGAFLLVGIAPGTHTLTVLTQVFPPLYATPEVAAGSTTEVTLTLVAGGTLVGTIRAEDGSPARQATVYIGGYGGFASQQARVRSDGSYVFEALSLGEHEVTASSRVDGKASGTVRIQGSTGARWNATLSGGSTVTGRVVDENGAPLIGWQVGAEQRPGLWESQAITDDDGRFELVNIPRHARSLSVGPPDVWTVGPALVLANRLPTEEDLLLTIPRRALPSASFEARLVACGDELAPDTDLILTSTTTWGWRVGHPDEEGRVRIERVIPGTYELEVHAPGCAVLRSSVTVEPNENLVLGNLVLTTGGHIRATTMVAGKKEALDHNQVRIEAESGRDMGWIQLEGGEGESQALPSGEYVLGLRARWRSPDVRVLVEDGETVSVELPVEPCVGCGVQIRVAEGAALPSTVSWEVFDGAGRLDQRWRDDTVSSIEGAPNVWIGGLLPGVWRVEMTAQDGRKGSVEVNVATLEQTFQTVELELR
jgi:RNA polymerase sigma-70 factor (ECF subfamily)